MTCASLRHRHPWALGLAFTLALGVLLIPIVSVQPVKGSDAGGIDAEAIAQIETALNETAGIESTTQRRRALKNIIRDAQSLIRKHTDSPERFRVLGVIFLAQRAMLVMRNDRRTQEDLVETCRVLVDAPDAYALVRLQAEVLLLNLDLDTRGATDHERALKIAALADRYRNTPAEVESLMVASELAFNLGEADLLAAFRYTLARKFKENLKAIAYLRERFAYSSLSIRFNGSFERADGEVLHFPTDRMGQVYLSCYWSTQTGDLKERLLSIKTMQEKYAGRFEVLSFNLDELPDAGQSQLDALGLDWTAMRLPGGPSNPYFRAYGADTQFLIRMTNLNGYVVLTPIGAIKRGGGRILDLEDYITTNLEPDAYLAFFQSLRIGEFLVVDPTVPFDPKRPPEFTLLPDDERPNVDAINPVPDTTLGLIDACFTPPPMRYGLSPEQAIKDYQQCVKLCRVAVAKHPDASNLWLVQNRRLIAQLGLWKLTGEPKHLREAMKDAEAVLAEDLPAAAQLPARFCVVLQAIRQQPNQAKQTIQRFLEEVNAGQQQASPLARAAATVLTLNAAEPELLTGLREQIFREDLNEPRLGPLNACLFDISTYRRLFLANSWGSEVMKRHGMLRQYLDSEAVPRRFGMALQTIDGQPISFPQDDPDTINVVIFLQPSNDKQSAEVQRDLMSKMDEHTGAHRHRKVNVVIASLSENRQAVRALAQRNGWAYPMAVVPDGLKNPDVLRLGIIMPDQRPNTFVVDHEGMIIWSMTGMNQLATSTNAVAHRIRGLVREHDLAVADAALHQGHFEKALTYYDGSFPPDPRMPTDIKNAQRLGQARARVRLGQHQVAIEVLDSVIAEHHAESARRACACDILAAMLQARAKSLEALGIEEAAKTDRDRAARLVCPPGSVADHTHTLQRSDPEIHQKLVSLRARSDWQGAFDYIDDIIVNSRDGRQAQRNALAGWLNDRAQALSNLEQPEQAKRDRNRARSLTEMIQAKDQEAAKPQDQRNPKRYVDIIIHAGN